MSDVKPRPEPMDGQIVVDLSDGHWALFRDPEEVTNRDTKAILVASEAQKGGDAIKAVAAVEQMVALILVDWSLFSGQHPKQNMDLFNDLKARDFRTLTDAASAHAALVFPDFKPSIDDESPS